MKKLIFSFAALLVLILASCSSPKPRTVENPPIAASNGISSIDITKVELNDSATVLYLHATYRPGWWIRLAKESHIVADGKDYPVLKAEGIELGEQFTMPESGEADFVLTFDPVPLDTKFIDFTEGTPDGWVFYGIDVTGKPASKGDYPEGLPKDIRDLANSEVKAEPVLDAAPSKLRFHLLGYRPEYNTKLNLYLYSASGCETASLALDENGEGTLETPLYGTTEITVRPEGLDAAMASAFAAPGETTDIYISPEIFSYYIDRWRDENAKPSGNFAYTNGRYAGLNYQLRKINEKTGFSPVVDWHMDGAAFTSAVIATRDSVLKTIAASDLPEPAKEFAVRSINLSAMSALPGAWNMLANAYYREKGEEGLRDSVKIEITPEQYASVAGFVDGDDTAYLMDNGINELFFRGTDWVSYGAKGALFKDYPVFEKALAKARAAKLNADDVKALESLSLPFYAKAAKLRQEEAKKAYEEALKTLAKTPEVPDEELFDAIIAKYKGKVVLVDLWNTWCGPCRNALKTNEPLKTGELANDDIVWVYIADDSSDMSQYAEMIKNIKGEHYKVTGDQIEIIRNRFNVDGIPYYILVDREGNAVGHPDFRDHNKLVEGIKAKL